MKRDIPIPPVSSDSLGAAPLVSRERFAEMVFGSKDAVGIVIGWANKGLIPLVTIGKYSLVNVALLQSRCLQKEFD